MKIISSAFEHNDKIPRKYTCEGDDINPPLQILNPPPQTKSFVIIVRDHDAPSKDFVHWIVWNIDQNIREIKEEIAPQGATEGTNDSGKIGWSGPCPPSGVHRYEFHLYALSEIIDLPDTSTKTELRSHIENFILKEASIIGTYQKESI